MIDAPEGYEALLGELPGSVTKTTTLSGAFDWVQYFVTKRNHVEDGVGRVKAALSDGALLWVSYPKAKQLETDLNRDRLADIGRSHGLQPVSQISVDEVWSALRFKVVG